MICCINKKYVFKPYWAIAQYYVPFQGGNLSHLTYTGTDYKYCCTKRNSILQNWKTVPFFCLFFVFLWLIFFLWQFMFPFFSYWIFFSKSNCKYMRLLSHVLGILLITLLWISITSRPHNEVRDDYLSNSVATINWMYQQPVWYLL